MLKTTVDFIEAKIKSVLCDFVPEIGIVLGSGLGELADEFCSLAIPYCEIPGFEASSVSGHKSRLVFAEINGKKVVIKAKDLFAICLSHEIDHLDGVLFIDKATEIFDADAEEE